MTDAEATPETPEEPDWATADQLTPKDWILEDLQNVFNNRGSAIGLTIQTNGATVSGLLIGVDEYLDKMKAAFEAPAPDMVPLVEVWETLLASTAKQAEERKEKGLPAIARRYIHMRDVRIFSGSTYLDFDFWRGSLSDVTGWSLGNVSRD